MGAVSPAETYAAFFNALRDHDMTAATTIMFTGTIDPAHIDDRGDNALNALARRQFRSRAASESGAGDPSDGSLETLVQALMKHDSPPNVHHEGAEGMTPLMATAKRNDVQLASLLVKHCKADALREGRCSETPWDYAVAAGQWDIVSALVDAVRWQLRGPAKQAMVRCAATAGRADVICHLADRLYRRDPLTRRSVEGDSLLMAVVRSGADDCVVQAVLDATGAADINQQNGEGDSALSLAIAVKPRYLYEKFEDPNDYYDPSEGKARTPRESYMRNYNSRAYTAEERFNVVRTLLAASADVSIKHHSGKSAVMLAAVHGRCPDMVEAILDANASADFMATDDAGVTVLMHLVSDALDTTHDVSRRMPSVIRRVVESTRLAINDQDQLGKTAFHKAVTLRAPPHFKQCVRANWRRFGRGCVPVLLEAGADANILDGFGDTALMVSLMCGSTTLTPPFCDSFTYNMSLSDNDAWFERLISAQDRVPLTHRNREGRSAVSLAAEYWPRILPKLLDAGAKRGRALLEGEDVAELARHAAAAGSAEAVARLLEHRSLWDVNARDEAGATALLHAVVAEAETQARRGDGSRPRFDADRCWVYRPFDSFRVVELLLEAGANVNLADVHGRTPTMYAGLCESCIQRPLLAARPPPNVLAADSKGNTALHYLFMQHPSFERARRYTNRYSGGKSQIPPLSREQQCVDERFLRHLLKLGGRALASAANCLHETPLLLAAACDKRATGSDGNVCDSVQLLLQATPDLIDCADCKGVTPVMAAVTGGRQKTGVLRTLLGASSTKPDLRKRDAVGDTALFMAVRRQDAPVAEELLRGDAGVELRDTAGATPLLMAIRGRAQEGPDWMWGTRYDERERIVEALLGPDARANPDVTDVKGRSALLLALGYGYAGMALLLLKAGAMSSVRDLLERQHRSQGMRARC